MCEPYHSIVQYPSQDDLGNPTESRLRASNKFLDWGKKILDWFHFSKLGSGHSEATGFGYQQLRQLPDPTSYEAHWWNRTVHLDGEFRGVDFNRKDAIECAEEYARRTSIGNLSILRRFLEGSLRATRRMAMYEERLVSGMLNHAGRDLIVGRLRQFERDHGHDQFRWAGSVKNQYIKLLMGFTRKRDLLVPEWADDNTLWTPGQ